MKFNLMTLLVLVAVVLFIGLVLYQNNKKDGSTTTTYATNSCNAKNGDADCGPGEICSDIKCSSISGCVGTCVPGPSQPLHPPPPPPPDIKCRPCGSDDECDDVDNYSCIYPAPCSGPTFEGGGYCWPKNQ